MSNSIHESSMVLNSEIGEQSTVFQGCRINDTVIGKHSFIGDNSVVKFSQIGNYAQIARNSMVQNMVLGDYSYCGMRLTAIRCEIGKFCAISWNVSIGGANHDYNKVTSHSFLYDPWFEMVEKPLYNRFQNSCCIIGNDVWIGAGVNVLRGVTIGDGAVIGAGTVVTKDVPPYAIVCGNPGHIIKYRFSEDVIEALLSLKWWDKKPEWIKDHVELFNMDANLETISQITNLSRFDS